MAYGDFKDLNRRAAADKVFNIARNAKYGRYQHGHGMVYRLFDKKNFIWNN